MELKVFTLPTCPTCPVAKRIVSTVAQKLGIGYREINMATESGRNEGLAANILGAPSIALDSEIIAAGYVVSEEKLEEMVKTRIERWTQRSLQEKP